MNKICIYCEENRIDILSREMCRSCYTYIRKFDSLPAKPPLKREYRNYKFIWNLQEKYGDEILNDVVSLKDSLSLTLQNIGDKYNVTREYIRQIYKKITGESYTKTLKSRRKKWQNLLKNDVEMSCVNNPLYKFAEYKVNGNHWKAAITENFFLEECEKRKFQITLLCKRKIDIVVNDYLIDIKSCFTPKAYGHNITPQLRFVLSEYQFKNVDFVACYHCVEHGFFIIPKDELNSRTIYISEAQTDYYTSKNRYWEFKDAWHLLK